MQHADYKVDDAAHLLYFGGRAFPCDRDIVAVHPWQGHALLLSADTDCLSLWDADGLIRTARVGVYPQDMAVADDAAYICGGADGKLHRLSLPTLQETAEFALPGMPERVCVHDDSAWVLCLLAEPEVCSALVRLDLRTGGIVEIFRFAGIPGALAADTAGLWVGVTEQVLHLPWNAASPDLLVEGIGLAGKIEVQDEILTIFDNLESRTIRLHLSPTTQIPH